MCVKIAYEFLEENMYIRYLVKKVKDTGILIDKPKREKPKTVRTPENIAAVAENVCEAPSTPIHRRSQQLNISETSLRRILHKDLCMTRCKFPLVQELKPIDYPMLFPSAKWTCNRLTEDPDFAKKNKHNCCICGTENPNACIEKPTHPKRVTV